MDKVILVDGFDKEIGFEEKIVAHQKGLLHRAFSILIFNSNNELLLQKRAISKYHSGGLWSNTCCSHPRPGESVLGGAHRRLKEELGFDCELSEIFSFQYRVDYGELSEHEFDHVLIGNSDDVPKFNPKEIEKCLYKNMSEIKQDIQKNPEKFTYWFKKIIQKYPKNIT